MKELYISDLMDDICPDEFGLELDEEPVSPERIRRILQKRGAVTSGHGRRPAGMRLAVRAAIAAALVLALSVTAYAVANYTDFFASVFGGEDAGDRTYSMPVDQWDEDGNQMTREIVIEDRPVDQDAAQALLGDTVAGGQSVTVGDYTCTVENLTMAENGVGVMTYSIENPKGLPEITVFDETVKNFALGGADSDAWAVGADGLKVYTPMFSVPDGMVDEISFLMTATDTRLEARSYIALFTDGACPDELTVDFFGGADAGEKYRLAVPLPELAEAAELTGPEGWTASLSPMGLMLKAPSLDDIDGGKTITVRFADGSEYMVVGDASVNNCPVSCVNENGTARYVFNRLVDPAEVTSVTVQKQTSDGQDLDLTFTR